MTKQNVEIEAAYEALDGRLGSGDDADGKAKKVLWACEAYVLCEDALPGDEFDSEDYSLPKAVVALVKQRDGERKEREGAEVTPIRELELRVLRAARVYTASGGIADAAELHEAVHAWLWADSGGTDPEESERAP